MNSHGDTIRGLSLDVGGTLIHPWPSVGHVYAEVAFRHGIQADPEILNQRFREAWKRRTSFHHSYDQWAEVVDETFGGEHSSRDTFFPELYERFAQPDCWKIYEDVLPLVTQARAAGFKIVATSNWDERLRPLLKRLDLDRYFEGIVVSHEVGAPKPSLRMFQAAATALNLAPAEILHVGDSWEEDVLGAQAAGMRAAWLKREGNTDRPRIRRLTEISL